MLADFEKRLAIMADVIVRVGLNLQPGQRLLITEPYELHGVARTAEIIVEAVKIAAQKAGTPLPAIEVIWGDGPRLREFAAKNDWRGFAQLVKSNAGRMERHLKEGGAFLFLLGSQPRLLVGIAADRVDELHRIGWIHTGAVIQRLMRGESQWTLVPAPSPGWAEAVYADLPSEKRLAALWTDVFSALKIPGAGENFSAETALTSWAAHLGKLRQRCNQLNDQNLSVIKYVGPGTDLSIRLPARHAWCTAQLSTRTGVSFVLNLPTEEIFTAPHKNSASGVIRVDRPVSHAGAIIEGMELEFKSGQVVNATARTGAVLLRRLLETDLGARRLGEVAIVPSVDANSSRTDWQAIGRCYQHTLMDENSANHVALGESYPVCSRAFFRFALNRSLVHLDLPLNARFVVPAKAG